MEEASGALSNLEKGYGVRWGEKGLAYGKTK